VTRPRGIPNKSSVGIDWDRIAPMISMLRENGHTAVDACQMAGVRHGAYRAYLARTKAAGTHPAQIVEPIPANAPYGYTHRRARVITETWMREPVATTATSLKVSSLTVTGIARYLGLRMPERREIERRCLGGCGGTFKSVDPPAIRRICDNCKGRL
jgi:hypothetical protein